jgi:hypothetical protein
MTTFAPTAPAVAPPDPSKHVNFTLGMVLGVDDFTQEFGYLSARDRWIVRDLIGYGVVSGLRVTIDDPTADNPRVMVAPGVAATPSGRLLCIAPAQCAQLLDWVRANRDDVERNASPPPDAARLYVVACYRECPVDDVPIPGEPCRSEEDLMAPSRMQDSFQLELRLDAPEQLEEDSIRDFVQWLSAVPVVEGATENLDDFLTDLRTAGAEQSPPESPPDYLVGSPPAGLVIPRERAGEFLRAAFEVWTTELRPQWRTSIPGCDCGCGEPANVHGNDADCVLLGEIDVSLVYDLDGEVFLDSVSPPVVDTSRRPTILPVRMLQEWMLRGLEPADGGMLASATVEADGTVVDAENAAVTQLDDRLFHFGVEGFDPARHSVSALPFGAIAEGAHVVELIAADDPDLPALSPPEDGFVIRFQHADGSVPTTRFTVAVSAR